jgi:hypothetical protein
VAPRSSAERARRASAEAQGYDWDSRAGVETPASLRLLIPHAAPLSVVRILILGNAPHIRERKGVRYGTLASADLEKLSQAMASGMYPAFFIAMAFNCMEGEDDGGGGHTGGALLSGFLS